MTRAANPSRAEVCPRPPALLASAVLAVFVAAMPAVGTQLPGSGSAGSYRYLSANAQGLIDGFLVDILGLPRGAASYNSLEESRRSTYEAIMHALESLGLEHIVVAVTGVWGVSQSTDGRDQYRISTTLAP